MIENPIYNPDWQYFDLFADVPSDAKAIIIWNGNGWIWQWLV